MRFRTWSTRLDPGGLQKVLVRLLEDWSALLEEDVIAIDGKSLRRSFSCYAAPGAGEPSLWHCQTKSAWIK